LALGIQTRPSQGLVPIMNQADSTAAFRAFRARWYAIRVIIVYFFCIATFVALAYLDLRWVFGILAACIVGVLASAIYRELYYDKLAELETEELKRDQSRTN